MNNWPLIIRQLQPLQHREHSLLKRHFTENRDRWQSVRIVSDKSLLKTAWICFCLSGRKGGGFPVTDQSHRTESGGQSKFTYVCDESGVLCGTYAGYLISKNKPCHLFYLTFTRKLFCRKCISEWLWRDTWSVTASSFSTNMLEMRLDLNFCLLSHVLQALDKRRCKVSPTLKNVCFQCVMYIRRSSQTVLLLEQSVRRIRDLRFVLKDKYKVSCVLWVKHIDSVHVDTRVSRTAQLVPILQREERWRHFKYSIQHVLRFQYFEQQQHCSSSGLEAIFAVGWHQIDHVCWNGAFDFGQTM